MTRLNSLQHAIAADFGNIRFKKIHAVIKSIITYWRNNPKYAYAWTLVIRPSVKGSSIFYSPCTGRCGLGAPLAQQAGTDDWFMFWVKSGSDGAEAYKKSPNCWYSESYEAISNLGKNIGTPSERKITLTCTIEHFCISSSDTECFVSIILL